MPAPGHRAARARALWRGGVLHLAGPTTQQSSASALFERIVAEEGQDVPGLAADRDRRVPRSAKSARAVEPVMWHAFVGRAAGLGRRPVRAEALRHPQAVRERDRGLRARRPQVLLLRQPVVPHPRLQGNAHAPSSSGSTSPTTWATRCSTAHCACSTRGSAPTRSRAGSWPTPTG